MGAGMRCVFFLGPFQKIARGRAEPRNRFSFCNANLTLGESRPKRSFYFTSSPLIPNIRALTIPPPAVPELEPINPTPLEH
jgi:hypothetical protein